MYKIVWCTCKVVVLLIKPIDFLPFSLPSRSSLLKLIREFKQRSFWATSTGSEVFSLPICLDSSKFVLLSFFSLIKTIRPRVSTKPLPNDAKSPLPVDVRRSKTLLLKLPSPRRYLPKINYPNLSLLTAKFCISQNFEIKKKGKPSFSFTILFVFLYRQVEEIGLILYYVINTIWP